METLVKECVSRQKDGRCTQKGHYCCYLPKAKVVVADKSTSCPKPPPPPPPA